MKLYLYGITRENARGALNVSPGIQAAPVQTVVYDGLVALVSEVGDDTVRSSRSNLVAHARVLNEAMNAGPVLPIRFGTIVPTAEGLRLSVLEERRDELTALLDQFENLVEVGLKGIWDETTVFREIVEENADIQRLREVTSQGPEAATYAERVHLGELVAAALQRKNADAAAEIYDRLIPLAEERQEKDPLLDRMVVNAVFLVTRDNLHRFDEEVDALDKQFGDRMLFRYVGPTPPYHFTELGA